MCGERCNASGTLVSYLLLRELRRRDGPMHVNWLKVVVHRYWRYVPTFFIELNIEYRILIELNIEYRILVQDVMQCFDTLGWVAQCGLRGFKNRPAPFPGQML